MTNPEAEFVPKNAQARAGESQIDPGSGDTAAGSSEEATNIHDSGDTADAGGRGPDENGVHDINGDTNGESSRHDSGDIPSPAANTPADPGYDANAAPGDGYGPDASAETAHDPSVAPPPTGPEYGPSPAYDPRCGPAPSYYHNPGAPSVGPPTGPEYGPPPGPTGPPAGPVYNPGYGPAPGYYPNNDPGFDHRYAQAHQINHQPQPMYHYYNSYPPYANPEYPAHPEYHTYNPYPTHHPPYPAYQPHPPPNNGYAAHAYTPSQPEFAAGSPQPSQPAPPLHYGAYIHSSKGYDMYNPSPSHIPPMNSTTLGEMGDPEAKIFVGDLPIGDTTRHRTTHYLESCLKGIFWPFGQCWVNVSWGETARKGEKVKKLPTGWIQYKKVADAEKVLARAKERGIYVGDRRLRIERADGKRIIRLWPKNMSSSLTVKDMRKEFRRFMGWLTSITRRKFLFHISDCGEFVTKSNGPVLSVGVMFRWCEDAHFAAKHFQAFPSNFQVRIEPVRTMTGLPSWRTSKLDCKGRIEKLQLDPGHEWHGNMNNMYTEVIDEIEVELDIEQSLDETSISNNNNNTPQPSDNRPRQPTSNNSSPSGLRSSSTLEDIEYERGKKARKAMHWSNVVLRIGSFKVEEQKEQAEASSSSVQNGAHLHTVLDTVEEEEEEEEEATGNHFCLNSAVEDEEEEWEDDDDTVVAVSDSGASVARQETREESKQGTMPAS